MNGPSTPSRGGANGDLKPPKGPERPLVPYMRFSRKMWPTVRADNPEAQLWEMSKVIGQLWRECPEKEKSVFQAEYEAEKVEYDKAMKSFQQSPAYQSYIQQNKARQQQQQQAQQAQQQADRAAAQQQHHMQQAPPMPMPGMTSGHMKPIEKLHAHQMSRSRNMDMSGVVIHAVDEDDQSSEMNIRRAHYARYQRNQNMMAELFGPQSAQDMRTIVAQARVDMLRKQGQSLSGHQDKLNDELRQMDETFAAKMRDIEEKRKAFQQQLEKVEAEKPVLDDAKKQELIAKWEVKLVEEYEAYKKKEEEMAAAAAKKEEEAKNSLLASMLKSEEDDKKENEENRATPEVVKAAEVLNGKDEEMDTTTVETPASQNVEVN
ncbi:unnamed protein product, partial [Mesorhabditis spiculigera]